MQVDTIHVQAAYVNSWRDCDNFLKELARQLAPGGLPVADVRVGDGVGQEVTRILHRHFIREPTSRWLLH